MNKPSPLKQEIIRQGRIQADVALEAGISESRMSRIVNRRVTIQDHERRHLARILGLNHRDFYRTIRETVDNSQRTL
jgi:hypothetical protein